MAAWHGRKSCNQGARKTGAPEKSSTADKALERRTDLLAACEARGAGPFGGTGAEGKEGPRRAAGAPNGPAGQVEESRKGWSQSGGGALEGRDALKLGYQLASSMADIAVNTVQAKAGALAKLTPTGPDHVGRVTHRGEVNLDGVAAMTTGIGLGKVLRADAVTSQGRSPRGRYGGEPR